MVCIPCIIAPVLLFIWYRFIQPIVLKFWNPWAPKESIKESPHTAKSQTNSSESACPFAKKTEVEPASIEKESGDKKTD